jgi:hypothetical protein
MAGLRMRQNTERRRGTVKLPTGWRAVLGRLWCRWEGKHVGVFDWGWTYDPTVRIGGGNAVPRVRLLPSVSYRCTRCGAALPFPRQGQSTLHTHL